MTLATNPLTYLDKALGTLRSLGLVPEPTTRHEAPIVALLQEISDLDEDRVVAITRTLAQASLFHDVVREQVQAMDVGTRYERIANAFDSIRDDAKAMVDQVEDGKISTFERLSNAWMKVTRGDVADRFDKIKETYLEVTAAAQDQLRRESLILDAYADFRGALKQSEVLAFEVLRTAEEALEAAKADVDAAMADVAEAADDEPAERARRELSRDEDVRVLQDADRRYQIAKDLSDNLTIGYNTSEVVMARLMQTHTAKERVRAQAVSFFGTNETVLTALSASFTGLSGLHESTKTLDAMKEGVERSLEAVADLGGRIQEDAIRAGYGPTVRVEAVRRLVDAVVEYQSRSREIVDEMRTLSTVNAAEIAAAVEDGKRRLARLAQREGV
jgi:hypothetical protein